MSDTSPQLLKALFAQLVTRCGGTHASGAYLGVSHQRISALQSLSTDDMPTTMQLWKLQKWIKDGFVFDALAAEIRADGGLGDIAKEAREVTYAAVDLQRCTDAGKVDWAEVRVQHARLLKELEDLTAVLATAPA